VKRALRLAEHVTPAADSALRALAVALRPILRQLDEAEGHRGELVDVVQMIPSSKRAVMAACRAGKIAGAVRIARRWCAPKASVEAWLQQFGPRPVELEQEEDGLEQLRKRISRGR
jgi:hypothetical protein